MFACHGKVAYLSEAVARNACTLHQFALPQCGGIRPYRCGDHWHIGHPTRAVGDACKALASPVLLRAPARRPGR